MTKYDLVDMDLTTYEINERKMWCDPETVKEFLLEHSGYSSQEIDKMLEVTDLTRHAMFWAKNEFNRQFELTAFDFDDEPAEAEEQTETQA